MDSDFLDDSNLEERPPDPREEEARDALQVFFDANPESVFFSRQIEVFGVKGDIFIAISTSGNSPNILKAIAAAKEKGLRIYGWSGLTGGKLAQECSTLCVPSKATARIQECHIMIGHLLCEMAEANFLPKQI